MTGMTFSLLRLHPPRHPHLIRSISFTSTRLVIKSIKDRIDYSKYPTLKESDIEEKFIHGGGPGGQKVNKAHNCVQIRHIPTNIVVKCHEAREQYKNRETARQWLLERLDDYFNGDQSVQNQIKRIEEERSRKLIAKQDKKRLLKAKFKEELEKSRTRSLELQDKEVQETLTFTTL